MTLQPGMPYGVAPAWCFTVFELGMYVLFIACAAHAAKKGAGPVLYLLGGLAFGLLLEYMEVLTGSYTYGRFIVMLGKAPANIPFCIGIGWGIIMYTGRLFTDRLALTLWACAALDTLLALNIDLSMDTVAYRLHMWNWDWRGTGLNPLTAQWFGIPYGNFVGWQTVVFCYSAFSRVFESNVLKQNSGVLKYVLIALLALLCSLFVLYSTETWLFPLLETVGILYLQRFIGITVVLFVLLFRGWRKWTKPSVNLPAIALWVPGWFHLFFFAVFFILSFYRENPMLTLAACLNLLVGVALHVLPFWGRWFLPANTKEER